MTEVDHRLAEISASLPAVERLEKALEICAVSPGLHGPDYGSFQNWIQPHLQSERRTICFGQDTGASRYLGVAVLIRIVSLQKELTEKTPPDIVTVNKFKLLFSLIHADKRGLEVLEALSTKAERLPEFLTDDLADVTPAELRLRLFTAVERDNANEANFIMGRLDHASLHEGEHDYLHALIRFKLGDIRGAARLADKVAPTAIDGLRAAYIAAKAYAIIGNLESARAACEIAGPSMASCQWLHLADLAGWYSGAEFAVGMLGDGWHVPKGALLSDDPGYGEWAKFHVRVLIQMFERLYEIQESIAAGAGDVPASIDDMLPQLFTADPILMKGQVAFMLDPMIGSTFDPIHYINLLAPLIERGDREALLLAYEAHQIGLTPAAPVEQVTLSQRRFGIDFSLPFLPSKPDFVSLRSHPHACRLRIRQIGFQDVWVNAELYVPGIPGLPPELQKCRVVGDFLELVFNPTEAGSAKLRFSGNEKRPIPVIRALVDVLSMAERGPIDVSIRVQEKVVLAASVSIPQQGLAEWLNWLSPGLSCLEVVSTNVVPPDLAISVPEIVAAWDELVTFNALVAGDELSGRMTFAEPFRFAQRPDSLLAYGYIEVGDWVFMAIAARAILRFQVNDAELAFSCGGPRIVEALVRRGKTAEHLDELIVLYRAAMRAPGEGVPLELCGGDFHAIAAYLTGRTSREQGASTQTLIADVPSGDSRDAD